MPVPIVAAAVGVIVRQVAVKYGPTVAAAVKNWVKERYSGPEGRQALVADARKAHAGMGRVKEQYTRMRHRNENVSQVLDLTTLDASRSPVVASYAHHKNVDMLRERVANTGVSKEPAFVASRPVSRSVSKEPGMSWGM